MTTKYNILITGVAGFLGSHLSEKLLAMKEKLGDAYGGPLMEELIIRMERTVAHFDFEVETMLKKVTKRL